MTKIPLLNGLRALAIVGVVWQHACWRFFEPGAHPLAVGGFNLPANPLASNGWLGVNLFFFCSGLVLYLPYCSGTRQFASLADDRWFWSHRAKRLLPLFYFSLLIGCATFLDAADVNSGVLLRALLAFLGLSTFFQFSFFPVGNWVLWSLEIEILFSLIFPQLARIAKARGIIAVLVSSVLLGLTLRALGNVFFRGEPYLNFVSDNIFGRLDDFVWGMFAADLYVRGKLPRRASLTYLGGALMLAAGVTSDLWYVGALPIATQSLTYGLFDVGVFLMVSGLLAGRSVLRTVLELAPFQVLGMMCFSIYVWHGIILNHLFPHIVDAGFSPRELVAGLPLFLFLLAAISAMSYRFMEFPSSTLAELFMLPRLGAVAGLTRLRRPRAPNPARAGEGQAGHHASAGSTRGEASLAEATHTDPLVPLNTTSALP
jgi:peptidoglycan/LPS O-acetylase OafA/YrhL